MENTITSDEQATDDIYLALSFAGQQIACSHYTPPNMLNPSPLYRFANNPGFDACSHPVIADATPGQDFVRCAFMGKQFICSYYSPEYSIISKRSLNPTKFYYLTKYRSYDSSYVYKIYDSNSYLYQTFEYKQIDAKNNDLDTEALSLFESFLNDAQLKTELVVLNTTSVSTKSQKTSYLSTLVS